MRYRGGAPLLLLADPEFAADLALHDADAGLSYGRVLDRLYGDLAGVRIL